MTNNSSLRGIFGKSLIIGFALAILSVASFAQSNYAALYNKSNNALEGYIAQYGNQYKITWASSTLVTIVTPSCIRNSDTTSVCITYTYRNGVLEHQGEYQNFTSGVDIAMRYTSRYNINHYEREYNDGWTAYYIR
jgi:hypothetical protein